MTPSRASNLTPGAPKRGLCTLHQNNLASFIHTLIKRRLSDTTKSMFSQDKRTYCYVVFLEIPISWAIQNLHISSINNDSSLLIPVIKECTENVNSKINKIGSKVLCSFIHTLDLSVSLLKPCVKYVFVFNVEKIIKILCMQQTFSNMCWPSGTFWNSQMLSVVQ